MSAEAHDGPLVSVLMPVHNAERYVAQAVESVLAQTFTDFELILIDDGSTDGSRSILQRFTDPKVKLITHAQNRGLVSTLNEGLRISRGKYIARMDADDRMHPDRLARQVAYMEAHADTAVVASFVDLMNADDEIIGTWDTDRSVVQPGDIKAMMARTNCIAHPSVLIRRSALKELDYDERQKGAEDWDLWLRLVSRGRSIHKIPEPLLTYRVHAASTMGKEKAGMSLERRLMRTRRRLLLHEWSRGHFSSYHFVLLMAQVRNLAGMWLRRTIRPLVRDLYRAFTYSPIALQREARALRKASADASEGPVLMFPYLGIGGAERVHANIARSVSGSHPTIIFFGRSADRGFAQRFEQAGQVLELPRLLHHPFTRKSALRRVAALINSRRDPVLLASLSDIFFQLLPLLDDRVRTLYLQHAFLYQPEGNMQWKAWLPWLSRVDNILFVSEQARAEFDRFLFHHAIPAIERAKLRYISNAVERFAPVGMHDRPGLVFVGRNSPEKRAHLFLLLCERLNNAYPGAFRFATVGLPTHVSSAPLEHYGEVTDDAALSRILSANDVLVLTSDREGFPMVIMEAMAHGLAIVSTPVGDVQRRMDQAFAHVAPSIDEEVFLSSAQEFLGRLHQEPGLLMSMRQAAHARALADFNMEAFVRTYRSLLLAKSDRT